MAASFGFSMVVESIWGREVRNEEHARENYSSSFDWSDSPLTFSDLAAMGYQVIIVSLACMRVSLQAVWDFAQDMIQRQDRAEKDFERRLKGHATFNFNQFAGFPQIKEKETAFLPTEEVSKKYEESIGYFADRK